MFKSAGWDKHRQRGDVLTAHKLLPNGRVRGGDEADVEEEEEEEEEEGNQKKKYM